MNRQPCRGDPGSVPCRLVGPSGHSWPVLERRNLFGRFARVRNGWLMSGFGGFFRPPVCHGSNFIRNAETQTPQWPRPAYLRVGVFKRALFMLGAAGLLIPVVHRSKYVRLTWATNGVGLALAFLLASVEWVGRAPRRAASTAVA